MTYKIDDFGIYRPEIPVTHRDVEYQETGFETLVKMQSKHFWYIGRHKFLFTSLQKYLKHTHQNIIDLGGGVGGWIKYLTDTSEFKFKKFALGDSSNVALIEAKKVLPKGIDVFQVDLMSTQWNEVWDVIFLLDVLEHCPDDVSILNEVYKSLKPGGLLIMTTPALMCFWSHNDEYAKHLRRYSAKDYVRLASLTNFKLIDARYFMFFLSPLYWLSRKFKLRELSEEDLINAIKKEHEIPHPWVNYLLTKLFSAESAVGHAVRFPWGTSILGVFQKL